MRKSELSRGRCLWAQRVSAQRALLSRLCRQDSHRCGARADGMYIWDRGGSWRQRDKDTQSWRGTRTRARHRPALSYASVAMCVWHLAGPRLSIESLCVAQNMPAGHRGQWGPSPLTSIKRRRWKWSHDRAPVRSVKSANVIYECSSVPWRPAFKQIGLVQPSHQPPTPLHHHYLISAI